MKNKIIKDSIEFFVILFIFFIIFDFLRDKKFDYQWFLDLLAKSIIAAVIFGFLLFIFRKTYQKYSGKKPG